MKKIFTFVAGILFAAASLAGQNPKPTYPYGHAFHSTVNDRIVFADAWSGSSTAAKVMTAISVSVPPAVIIITPGMSGTAGDFTGITLTNANFKIEDERGASIIWGFKDPSGTDVIPSFSITQNGIAIGGPASCLTFPDLTQQCTAASGGIPYPGAGIAISTGVGWAASAAAPDGNVAHFLNGLGLFSTPPGGTPGGAANSVQYNNGGAFGGFGTWDGSTLTIPNAANNGVTFGAANGRVTGAGGGYLGFNAGSPSLVAGGTTQNLILQSAGNPNSAGVVVQDSGGLQGTLYLKQGTSINGVLGVMNSSGTINPDLRIVLRGSNLLELLTKASGGTGVFIQDSSNAPHMQISQSTFIPTSSGCGTGATVKAGSSDMNGSLTVGTTAGSCVVTFRGAFTTAPVAPICIDATANTVIGCTTSTTQLTLGTVVTGDEIRWWLTGN